MKIIIYGDVGGNYKPLIESLAKHGVMLTALGATIPEDTIVIQVGDLIDRGPQSDELVHAVDNTIYESNPRWIQLFGNHEGNWMDWWHGPCQFGGFDDDTTDKTKETLRKWWKDRAAKMAVGIETENGPYLITHAGLSWMKWNHIKAPTDLAQAVNTLNSEDGRIAFAPGTMLGGAKTGGTPDRPVGVAWTQTVNELYIPWLRAWDASVKAEPDKEFSIPFHQVHGHCSGVWWNRGFIDRGLQLVKQMYGLEQEAELEVNWEKRLSTAYIADRQFHSVDQSLGKDPWFDLEPLVLEGELVL